MLDELLEAWRIHERINRHLLDSIPAEGLAAIPLLKTGQPGRGRNVARQFAHLVDVRLSHLRVAEKARLKGLALVDKHETPARAELEATLAASGAGVEDLFRRQTATGDLVHGRGPAIVLAYLVSHESHHRGQIMLALKQNGIKVDEDLKWDLWSLWFKDQLPARKTR